MDPEAGVASVFGKYERRARRMCNHATGNRAKCPDRVRLHNPKGDIFLLWRNSVEGRVRFLLCHFIRYHTAAYTFYYHADLTVFEINVL